MELNKLSNEQLIEFIKLKVNNFAITKIAMQESIDYYNYQQDILKKERLAIGENGRPVRISNLPNSRIIDNQYAKVVDQKVNYIFSDIPIVKCADKAYQEKLQSLYDKRFLRTLNKIALESYLCGISWLYVSNNKSKLDYMKLDSREIIPIWRDKNHEKLEALVRCYTVDVLEDGKIKQVNKVAFHTDNEVKIFSIDNGDYKLESTSTYLQDEKGQGYTFGKIPFIYFKANSQEIPLLAKCKSLQDGINTIISNFQDNMLEDPRNTILVIKNYDGENLGEFREKLATYGAIKVSSIDGVQGGVEALEIKVNAENYKAILSLLKEKLIENTRGVDAKNDKTTQAPNELNIKSMYSDIELDANAIELEFTASLEHLERFYKQVNNIAINEVSSIKFKRNIMVNEESQVNMIRNSVGILSTETLIANHPLIDNVNEELEKLKKEKEEEINNSYNPFENAE